MSSAYSLCWENLMTYIQIPEEHDARGFLELAKSGSPVCCLPQNSYGVSDEHLRLLKRKRIPFKELKAKKFERQRRQLDILITVQDIGTI